MKTLVEHVLSAVTLPWAQRGPADQAEATAKDKGQWEVPSGVRDCLRELAPVSVFTIQKIIIIKKIKPAGSSLVHHRPSAQSQAVLSEAPRKGTLSAPHGDAAICLGAQPHMFWRLPKQSTEGVKLGFRTLPCHQGFSPSTGLPGAPHVCSNAPHCLCLLPSWP